jgi:hypothetical protein
MNNYKIGVYNSNNPYTTQYRRQEDLERVSELQNTINNCFNEYMPKIKEDCSELVMRKIEPILKSREANLEGLKDLLGSAKDNLTEKNNFMLNDCTKIVKDLAIEMKNNFSRNNLEIKKLINLNCYEDLSAFCKMFEGLTGNENLYQLNSVTQEMTGNIDQIRQLVNYYLSAIYERLNWINNTGNAENADIEAFKSVILRLKEIEDFANQLEEKRTREYFISNGDNFSLQQTAKVQNAPKKVVRKRYSYETPIFFRTDLYK